MSWCRNVSMPWRHRVFYFFSQRQWVTNGGKCGICGDPWDQSPRKHEVGGQFYKGTIVRTYKRGQVIDAYVHLTSRFKQLCIPFWLSGFVDKQGLCNHCPACRTTLVATRFRVAVICPIIQVPHCIRVFFYFVWFVFINHIFQFYYELCTYCNILDIYLS